MPDDHHQATTQVTGLDDRFGTHTWTQAIEVSTCRNMVFPASAALTAESLRRPPLTAGHSSRRPPRAVGGM